MPLYFYKCRSCENEEEVFHSIKDRITDCYVCAATGSMIRIPSQFMVIDKTKKSGQIVKDFIEEAKEDLKQQKRDIKK